MAADYNNVTPTKQKKRKASNTTPVVDLSGDSQTSTAQKRKRTALNREATTNPSPSTPKKSKKATAPKTSKKETKSPEKGDDGEKRLRKHRSKPPGAYLEIRNRALTQRMYVIDRQRTNNADIPAETVTLVGSTGNIYTIVINAVPSCDCPHAKKGNQCKHIAYVLTRVLRAPAALEYQLAFKASELCEIFEQAPPLPSETAEETSHDGKRKPIEGDCPICCVEFEPNSREKLVYCKAACGNNMHEECFKQWATTKKGGSVPCPFCRTPWQEDEEQLKRVASSGERNEEGYVNVAGQLGLAGRRDYSTYHPYWVRQQVRRGLISWDEEGVMGHEY